MAYAIRKLFSRRRTPGDDVMRRFVGWFVIPVWLGAGFLDYVWHRRTKIETTSGMSESLSHTLMMAEAGPAVLAGLLLEANAGALALMIAAAVVHEATAMWDVHFTAPRRAIPPGEQHVHTALEAVPFCVAAVAICTHWDEFLTLLGRGTPDFELRLRRPPEGWKTVAAVFAAMTALGAIPHAEEFWRCRKAQAEGREGSETPECARQLFG